MKMGNKKQKLKKERGKMTLLKNIKDRLIVAIKARETTERDVLRVAIADVQTLCMRNRCVANNNQIENILRNICEKNNESLGYIEGKEERKEMVSKLKAENAILESFLPKTLSTMEIEAFFLNHDSPMFENIRDANSEGMAMGIAMKTLKGANQQVLGEDVKKTVQNIRK